MLAYTCMKRHREIFEMITVKPLKHEIGGRGLTFSMHNQAFV